MRLQSSEDKGRGGKDVYDYLLGGKRMQELELSLRKVAPRYRWGGEGVGDAARNTNPGRGCVSK